jgi:uncharacterized protein (DUF1810 family)
MNAGRAAHVEDPHNLRRFLDAQAGVIDAVRAELRAGQKRSHWMWFIFPQVAGLGHSDMARRYAISSLAEAQAYLAHPVLGARLRNCVQLVNQTEAHSIEEIFGSPDDLKFRSSMTLFAVVDADGGVFDAALKKYFGGKPDDQTLAWAR